MTSTLICWVVSAADLPDKWDKTARYFQPKQFWIFVIRMIQWWCQYLKYITFLAAIKTQNKNEDSLDVISIAGTLVVVPVYGVWSVPSVPSHPSYSINYPQPIICNIYVRSVNHVKRNQQFKPCRGCTPCQQSQQCQQFIARCYLQWWSSVFDGMVFFGNLVI